MNYLLPLLSVLLAGPAQAEVSNPQIDFNRDIRPIVSNKCYFCHGPDEKQRKAELRLDTPEGAFRARKGKYAIVPNKPEQSELARRISTSDIDDLMPPPESGKKLSDREKSLLTQWIKEGAKYARHWSYVKPVRPAVPTATGENADWPRGEIDQFILHRLAKEGLKPSEEAGRLVLIRRAALDLTGLPPSVEEVEQFIADKDPKAYEHLIDRLLQKESYGEHWARMWLDLARYADSAGYADDQPRTIWSFRDYVIKSLNANKPFDQFTIEQIAGDLLADPTEEQLVATAFHRNTQTNNEGGTNDEEYRNVAVVDRVNTTMATWMGTTINCAQCHNHKYDPITQEEFFKIFAIFNNSEDADRRDESPYVQITSDEQRKRKEELNQLIGRLEEEVKVVTPEILQALAEWEKNYTKDPKWEPLRPTSFKAKSMVEGELGKDGLVKIKQLQEADIYTVEIPLDSLEDLTLEDSIEDLEDNKVSDQPKEHLLTALRLETQAQVNFVITGINAAIIPPKTARLNGRFVSVINNGKAKFLHLAEVEVFSGADNVARKGKATQHSTDFGGPPERGIDGNTSGKYSDNSVTHTAQADDPWWQVDLKTTFPIDRIVLWNRTDGATSGRLTDFTVKVLDENQNTVWEQRTEPAPEEKIEYSLSGARGIRFASALADYQQSGFDPQTLIDKPKSGNQGWAVGGATEKPHWLILVPEAGVKFPEKSKLEVQIEQQSPHKNHTLQSFRLSASGDQQAVEFAQIPSNVLSQIRSNAALAAAGKKVEPATEVTGYYLTVAPAFKAKRDELAKLQDELKNMKPSTTVPVMKEMANPRVTKLQHRGNFLDTGEEVKPGLPEIFHPLPEGKPFNRLGLAYWLVDENNPLTARVIVNRCWEVTFGTGIVLTSEEFGSQGELPVHPDLLDWLATELVQKKWDMKYLLKLMVTSAAYRQSSQLTPAQAESDPDNRLLARGPRFRLSAEMIRDQALAVSGLLSGKLYGPPVNPPKPKLNLSAAFGPGIDWSDSDGEDRYRRAIYTSWRRSSPYPSMTTFDAPSREVCTVRRERTNTPLQALVTMNDPVYIEAAQALARRMSEKAKSPEEVAKYGFQLCLSRMPSDAELKFLLDLYQEAHATYSEDSTAAMSMATKPLGPVPTGANVVDLAAWTVVGNMMLNLDEMFMKR